MNRESAVLVSMIWFVLGIAWFTFNMIRYRLARRKATGLEISSANLDAAIGNVLVFAWFVLLGVAIKIFEAWS